MKKGILLYLFLSLVVFTNCTEQVNLEAEKSAVKAAMEKYNQSFKDEDIQLLGDLLAKDDDLVVFGTDSAEIFVGWEQARDAFQNMFDSFEDVKLTMRDDVYKLGNTGNTAWVSGVYDWDITVEEEIVKLHGMRFTAVFEKRSENWLIVHFHFSMPVLGQAVEY